MVRITNIVISVDLGCIIDLNSLCSILEGIKYDPTKFSGAIWKHPLLGGSCQVFHTGKMICNGSAKTSHEGYIRIRRYAHMIKKAGWKVSPRDYKILTISACHGLSGPLDIQSLCKKGFASWEPELFCGAMLNKGKIHFTCFHTGKVVITGIKSLKDLDSVVYPTIKTLETFT